MKIPHSEISAKLKEPFRLSQSCQAFKMYCTFHKKKMSEVSIPDLIDWIRSGLTKHRVGCSGKERYGSRKLAKQKLKTYKRAENDGVYECSHCGCWHITSCLLTEQKEMFSYFLYGTRLD